MKAKKGLKENEREFRHHENPRVKLKLIQTGGANPMVPLGHYAQAPRGSCTYSKEELIQLKELIDRILPLM